MTKHEVMVMRMVIIVISPMFVILLAFFNAFIIIVRIKHILLTNILLDHRDGRLVVLLLLDLRLSLSNQ